ncbi:uncharacterized protein [Nicotiana sylvestris]|uniref:uncharacterized protein n=1 Tax=Nicotiana sylvestris TaxID=4096 RepID=UPI00388C9838
MGMVKAYADGIKKNFDKFISGNLSGYLGAHGVSFAPAQPEGREAVSEEEQHRLERYKKYNPPTFSGLALSDAQGFLEECHYILCTMGIAESSGVSFTAFRLRGATYQWWHAYELDSPAETTSLIWTQFSDMFLREYVPHSLRDTWSAEFEQLRQGTMTILEYVVRFSDLARHAPALVYSSREGPLVY